MKPFITTRVIFFIGLICAYTCVSANDHFGVCYYGNQTVDHIVCTGPTVVSEVTVKSGMNVSGSLHASKMTAGSLTINGAATISEATIKGMTTMVGELTATRTTFNNNLTITANHARLDKVTVNGTLTLISSDAKPVLVLQCGTLITGSVIFKGTKGWVQMSNDTQVQGKVENATIEFVGKECN